MSLWLIDYRLSLKFLEVPTKKFWEVQMLYFVLHNASNIMNVKSYKNSNEKVNIPDKVQ